MTVHGSEAFHAFTAAATAYSMGRELDAAPPPPEAVARHLRRVLAAHDRSGADTVVLHGLGSGALPEALAESLPPHVALVVVDLTPELARALAREKKTDWVTPGKNRVLLCDTSAWAAVLLLALHGLDATGACHVANPDPACTRVDELREVQRLLTMHPAKELQRTTGPVRSPSLSVAAILHPDEPGLPEYFAQLPAWLEDVVVVWDAKTPPADAPQCATSIRHLAHPLDTFADQRNRMLEACTGQWVLYLDGDERLAPAFWDELPGLLCHADAAGFYLPRTTFDPDVNSCRVGFGLWPDLQLRLFRRTQAMHFVNPIHEKLTGLNGPVGVLLNRSIGHESALRKSADAIRQKLARFDDASGNLIRHRLNEAYPTLPCSLLDDPHGQGAPLRWLRLPENPAYPAAHPAFFCKDASAAHPPKSAVPLA